jgi:subtilisin-like proprotein convertase family protein
LGGGSLTQNQTGAIFRARRQDVDMALVELAAIPDQSFNVHYAGWDRSGDAPTGTVGIHHPRGDEKAISFSSQLLIQSNSCIISGTSNTHWTVPRWDDGTTEPGSSGSGIWHPQRQRVIGFLSGGGAACGNSLSDCYGRMDVAWDGADASSRLRDWLDPRSVSTPVGVDGADPFGFVIAVEPERISQCTREDARFAVSLAGVGGFSEEVTMSVAQAPGGTTTTFSVNPLSTDGSSELVIGNLADVDAGVYEMTLNAVSQSQSRQVTLGLTLFAGSPDAPVLSLPVSGSLGVNLFPNISWSAVADAIEYQVQIGLNGNFSNPVLDLITADTQLAVQSALAGDENYSVRVRAINSCGGGDWSTVGVFRTEAAYCKSPDLAIPDNSQDGVADVLDIATIGRLTDLEMVLVLEHTWIGDLIVRLVNQSTGTSIRLLENNNCDGNDINVRILDEAGRSLQTDCQSASIAYPEPSYSPLDALSAFDGEELAGGWTLQVSDNAAADTGVLRQWCLIPKLQIETVFGDSFERDERL